MRTYTIYTSTERIFYRLHHIYPDTLYITLLQQGWNRSVFSVIQNEMDRIHREQKLLSDFTYTPYSPFDAT